MYSKVLQRIIADSNITQEELSEKCKKLNAPISRGRINSILNNKAPAPSEKVSRAIAQICNIDERELVLEGYLENAPHELIDFLNKFQEELFELSLTQLENKIDKETKEKLLKEYKKETNVNLILEILDMEENLPLYENNYKPDIEEEEKNIIFNFEYPSFTIEDDSMENKIPKDSKLKLKIQEKYKNGDILLIEYNNINYVRLAIFVGKNTFLYALNSKYNSLYLNNEQFKIIAKVTSIEIKL